MDRDAFQSDAAGRLVRASVGDAGYWAFIPNRLPPKFDSDWKLSSVLSEADRALAGLSGHGRALPNPQLLISPFVRREAVLSSRIEGTQSELVDLYAFEAGQPSTPRDASDRRLPVPREDVEEVHNYVRAMEFGLERMKTRPISLNVIRELHAMLMDGVRGDHAAPGEFRRLQNAIGGDGRVDDARFVPPPVPQMHEALDDFEKYLHAQDVYPPLVRLAIIHYQFETIHPFRDGNGRIGRLLISLLTVSWNLLPSPLLYLSAYFERHRREYCDHLLAVSQRGTWKEWVSFFLRGVAEQAVDASARAVRLQDLQSVWRRKLTELRAPSPLLRLADSLFVAPIVNIPGAQKTLAVNSYNAAKTNVEKLVAAGILQQISEGSYDKVFLAREILDIVGGEADFELRDP